MYTHVCMYMHIHRYTSIYMSIHRNVHIPVYAWRNPHESKSCRSPTSWSSYWTPKFPTAATTSTRSSRWRLVFEILRRLIIVGNNHQHHQMLDQADRASCSRSVWCWRSLWSWSNVGVDGLYNDYNQKLTKLTSIRRVVSMEGKRRGLSILRRWSGEASDPRYIQIIHSDGDWSIINIFGCHTVNTP